MIEVHELRKSFDGVTALDLEHLAIAARTTLAVIGPSGCGKSTLLRIVVGLVTPDRGTVTIAGTPLAPATRRALRLRMGYVIQEGGLFPHLTARDNVALVPRDLGWSQARIDARVKELLELTRIAPELLDRFPAQLSGGQRQRIALIRALMLDPEVLLMDEPLAALDPMIRAHLQRDLREIFARLEKTVLFVTHDLAEAAFVGDEMVLLRAGRLVQRGTYPDLAQRPAEEFVTEFLRAQRPLAALAADA